jgi:signal transduction histidine kinase
LIIIDDVTDRAELEQRLVQADKLSSIGLLAAGVAHEVNTPLAVISTYAQMLAKQVAEDSQKSLILEKIAKQTFRASEIVNSLLNFSRTSTTSYGGSASTRWYRKRSRCWSISSSNRGSRSGRTWIPMYLWYTATAGSCNRYS